MILSDYKGADLFDELVDEHGKIRPYYRGVADKLSGLGHEELNQKLRSLELLFLKQGITFTVYGDDQGTERVFPFDPFPRVIPAGEWEQIEAGLVQRITALNLFLYDVYHEQRIIKDGVIPPEVIHEAYVASAVGRDYRDATPVSGSYWGGGDREMRVTVHVEAK